jgi:hypothetical protein
MSKRESSAGRAQTPRCTYWEMRDQQRRGDATGRRQVIQSRGAEEMIRVGTSAGPRSSSSSTFWSVSPRTILGRALHGTHCIRIAGRAGRPTNQPIDDPGWWAASARARVAGDSLDRAPVAGERRKQPASIRIADRPANISVVLEESGGRSGGESSRRSRCAILPHLPRPVNSVSWDP